MTDAARPVPLLGSISLELVQRIEHALDGGFAGTPIAGLEGDVQQRTSRRSHRIHITGILAGDSAADDLERLQSAAAAGDELDFSSDITSALDLQKVVIAEIRSAEAAGEPNRFVYSLVLLESPPLPPPARLPGFGGLDDLGLGDFGLGDLGIDSSMLGDLADMASDIAGAVDQAMNALDSLSALASGAALNIGGLLQPIQGVTQQLGAVTPQMQKAMKGLAGALTKGGDA